MMIAYLKHSSDKEDLGPLIEDGTTYSATRVVELRMLLNEMNIPFPDSFDPIPYALPGVSRFKYGTGAHSSMSRKMLGSIVLTATSVSGTKMKIRHMVIEGSSQWIVRKNVTSKVKIDHIERNALLFWNYHNLDSLRFVEHNFSSYIQQYIFCSSDIGLCISCLHKNMLSERP